MKRLIDFYYFIKNTNLQKENEINQNKNYSKIRSNSSIFQEKSDTYKSPDQPFPKIVFTTTQKKTDATNFSNNNYNDENDLSIKRQLLENILVKQRKAEYKSSQNKSYTTNDENNNNNNNNIKYKVFFPILKSNKNNIKENSDNNLTNEYDYSFKENNLQKNEEFIEKYMNILSIKPLKPKIKNSPRFQIKFPEKKKEEKISINNSNIKLEKIFNTNGILNNNNKFIYKGKFLSNENHPKANNVVFFSKSVKSLGDKIKINKPKKGVKIFPNINYEQSPSSNTNISKNEKLDIKENNETEIIKINKKILNQKNSTEKRRNNNDSIKIENLEKKEKENKLLNNSYSKENININFSKRIFKGIKILKDVNKMPKKIQDKKKLEKKLPKLEKMEKFKKPYQSLVKVNEKYLSKTMCPYNLNNVININSSREKYYYTVNKMYIKQLPEYMKHRVNWELIDTKAINLDEEKSININFQ